MDLNRLQLGKPWYRYFKSPQYAKIYDLLRNNKEMSHETITNIITPFDDARIQRMFEENMPIFNQPHDMKPIQSNQQRQSLENACSEDLIQQAHQLDYNQLLDLLQIPKKTIINTGVEEKRASQLYRLKVSKLPFYDSIQIKPKNEYFKQIITLLFSYFHKGFDNESKDAIIQYGGIEIVLNSRYFRDQTFREHFTRILEESETFIDLRRHGGVDIDVLKLQLVKQISKSLIQLKFNEQASQLIIKNIQQKPLSHVVALNQNLSNKQKKIFYESSFYKGNILKKYAQTLEYQNSLHYKVKPEITKILDYIEQNINISKQILGHVMNFEMYQLLKVEKMQTIKRGLFRLIFGECPNFVTAFKLVHYQGRSPQSLKESEQINQRLALVDIFLKISLPFEEWQIALNEILSRNYKIVDYLPLKILFQQDRSPKEKLLQYIFDVIEPYFHRKQKMMDFRSQTELALIKELMMTEFSGQIFEKILEIVTQTLDSPNFQSKKIKDLKPSLISCYNEKILQNRQFCLYKDNKRRDFEEENYRLSIDLKKKIYKKNFEEMVTVNYEKVDQYVKAIIENEGKIPNFQSLYPDIVELISQQVFLNSSFQLEAQELSKIIQTEQQSSILIFEDKQWLQNQLTIAVKEFVKSYKLRNPDSYFEKYLIERHGQNEIEYLKKLIEAKAFQDSESSFFKGLKLKSFLQQKVKAQFNDNANFYKEKLQQINYILNKIASGDEKNESREILAQSKQVLEENFKYNAQKLYEQYSKENPDSYFEKILNEKYNRDTFKLSKAFLENNVFENPETSFFVRLGYKQVLAKKMKVEIQKNANLAQQYLKKNVNS